jgi:hypothetical protein
LIGAILRTFAHVAQSRRRKRATPTGGEGVVKADSPVIARSECDEAIQSLIVALLDYFAIARNDAECHGRHSAS